MCALAVTTGLVPLATAGAASADCPAASAPPPAVDTSEVPKPGAASPGPLPVPDTPVGGAGLDRCGAIAPPAAPSPPAQVSAQSWVLADLDSGEVLAAHGPHARHRPASTIKILTALASIRDLRMDDTIVATQADADQEGSKVGLVPGTTYTVHQVLTGMIMQSGNDAAHALTAKVGGPRAMLDAMNRIARELGALDTRAATPSGLDGPGMSTSAYDLALIFRAAMADPTFAEAAATERTELPGGPGQPPQPVTSDNKLLLNYPGAIGAKSGFTDDARHTFVGAAERGGRRLVAVLLRGENQPIRQPKQAARLLDYGFGLSPAMPAGHLVERAKPPVAEQHRPPPPPAPQPAPLSSGTAAEPPNAGAVGVPLTIAAVTIAILLSVLAARRRRAKLTTRSGGAETPDEQD